MHTRIHIVVIMLFFSPSALWEGANHCHRHRYNYAFPVWHQQPTVGLRQHQVVEEEQEEDAHWPGEARCVDWLFCRFAYLLFLCFCSICVYQQVMSFCKCVSIIKYIIHHRTLGLMSAFMSRYCWQIVGRNRGLLTSKAQGCFMFSLQGCEWSVSFTQVYPQHLHDAPRTNGNLTYLWVLEILLTLWPSKVVWMFFYFVFMWRTCLAWLVTI